MGDLFDAVHKLQEEWVEEGRREANAAQILDADALALGRRHGQRLGYELGWIEGVVATLLETQDHWPAKAVRTATLLAQRLAEFPLHDLENEEFSKRLDVLRGLLKKLGARARFDSRVPDILKGGKDLSF